MRILRLPENGGKGSAVAAGAALLLGQPPAPEAIVVLDSDGQHDPERIPAFVEASRDADVVIGNRPRPPLDAADRGASATAPRASRCSPQAAWVPDTQNGMRLFRTEALREVPLPEGGYEAESRHLRASWRPAARSSRSRSRRSTTASRATTGRWWTRRGWDGR